MRRGLILICLIYFPLLTISQKSWGDIEFKSLNEVQLSKYGEWIKELSVNKKFANELRIEFLKKLSNRRNKKKVKQISLNSKYKQRFHLSALKVIEDYDDLLNDNLYLYFVIYQNGKSRIKLTSLYEGYDEGETVLFSPNDREVFVNQKGEESSIIIDYAIIESDGDDYDYLNSLAQRAWNILRSHTEYPERLMGEILVTFLETAGSLQTDSRLVTDSIMFNFKTQKEISFFRYRYSGERYWSEFIYDLEFRIFSENSL